MKIALSAWYEVFLDGRWLTLDARHNHPRIGRIVIARGRDAADVAISTAFGPAQLVRFNVTTCEFHESRERTLEKSQPKALERQLSVRAPDGRSLGHPDTIIWNGVGGVMLSSRAQFERGSIKNGQVKQVQAFEQSRGDGA
jgi:hypothetical protein